MKAAQEKGLSAPPLPVWNFRGNGTAFSPRSDVLIRSGVQSFVRKRIYYLVIFHLFSPLRIIELRPALHVWSIILSIPLIQKLPFDLSVVPIHIIRTEL